MSDPKPSDPKAIEFEKLTAAQDKILAEPEVASALAAYRKLAPVNKLSIMVLRDMDNSGLPVAQPFHEAQAKLLSAVDKALEKNGISTAAPTREDEVTTAQIFKHGLLFGAALADAPHGKLEAEQMLAVQHAVPAVENDAIVQEKTRAFQAEVLAEQTPGQPHNERYRKAEQALVDEIAGILKQNGVKDAPATGDKDIKNIPALVFEAEVVHEAVQSAPKVLLPPNPGIIDPSRPRRSGGIA